MNNSSQSCPICNTQSGSSLHIPILPVAAQGFVAFAPLRPLTTSASLFHCDHCDHTFLSPNPVPYYKTVYRSVAISAKMQQHRTSQFTALRQQYFPNKTSIRVLEIGSGDGQYLDLLARTFDFCLGTEPRQGHHLFANTNQTILHTHPDDVDFLDAFHGLERFDIIVTFNYLEHLPDPAAVLTKAKCLLNDDGVLLTEVPNSNYIRQAGLLNEIIPDHLHYFSDVSFSYLHSVLRLKLLSLESTWQDYILSCISQPFKPSPVLKPEKYDYLVSQINGLLATFPSDEPIVVWGAGHQSLFTITTTNLLSSCTYIVDSSPSKQNLYPPGLHIKVLPPSHLHENPPYALFVACASYNSEVIEMITDMNITTRIYSISGVKLTSHVPA